MARASRRNTLYHLLTPFLRWRPLVTRANLRADFSAGLTGAIVVLPQGVAFAAIAGMPPEYGLYAGMVPAIVAALFGSSWHLVSGPTTAASLVLFSALSALAEPGSAQYVQLALTLTFMVGIIQLVMGLARLGVLVNFISHSVIIGFTAGAALLIIANQLKHFFGVPVERGLHFHETLVAVGRQITDINPYVTAVALTTLLVGVLVKKLMPRLPYMIIAMLLGSALAAILDRVFGADHTAIQAVGALPASLPPLSMPSFDLVTIKHLAPATLAVTLFALTEAVSISRSIALKSGQQIDGNQEFFGQGLSNIAGSFFSGYVATGSFNRSGLNYSAGARTPVAAVFAGSLLMVIVVLVAPFAAYLPNAAMAGILMLVAWDLIDFYHVGQILRASRSETSILATTFFATMFLELEFAIFLGVMLSLGLYLARTSQPAVHVRAPDPQQDKRRFGPAAGTLECPQLRFVRIDGSLFFGAINYVQERLREFEEQHPEQKNLAIIASGINFIDLAGGEFLVKEARRRRELGGQLYLIRVKASVLKELERAGFLDELGRENIFNGKTEAIWEIFQRLDRDICAHCHKRVFVECQSLPPPVEEGVTQAPGGVLDSFGEARSVPGQ